MKQCKHEPNLAKMLFTTCPKCNATANRIRCCIKCTTYYCLDCGQEFIDI